MVAVGVGVGVAVVVGVAVAVAVGVGVAVGVVVAVVVGVAVGVIRFQEVGNCTTRSTSVRTSIATGALGSPPGRGLRSTDRIRPKPELLKPIRVTKGDFPTR